MSVNTTTLLCKSHLEVMFYLSLQATGKKKATPGGSLDQALERMCKRTRELRGQVSQEFQHLSCNGTVLVFLPGHGKTLVQMALLQLM